MNWQSILSTLIIYGGWFFVLSNEMKGHAFRIYISSKKHIAEDKSLHDSLSEGGNVVQ